jgi:tRNA(adenine34) deaminase
VNDVEYMHRALALAHRAQVQGDVPIGAVLVLGELICEASNEKELRPDPTAHAEMLVLREAALRTGNWRLAGATLYVTKEPCVMCAGAMVAARIDRLVFGCEDPKGGAAGGLLDLVQHGDLNHRISVTAGVLAEETAEQLRAFFAGRRGPLVGRNEPTA